MEALFENQFIRNRDSYNALYTYCFFQKPIPLVILSLCGLSILLKILSLIFWWDIYIPLPAEFVPIPIAILCIRYAISVKNAVNRDQEQFGTNQLPVTTIFTDESFCCISGNVETPPVSIGQIEKVVIKKNLIFLFTKAKLCYMLDKSNFTIGSYNDFILFLRSKGLKVKG